MTCLFITCLNGYYNNCKNMGNESIINEVNGFHIAILFISDVHSSIKYYRYHNH